MDSTSARTTRLRDIRAMMPATTPGSAMKRICWHWSAMLMAFFP